MANVDLAREVGLSPSPCLRRVRELEESGIIRRYVTLLNAGSVGLPVSVFVNVTLERQIERGSHGPKDPRAGKSHHNKAQQQQSECRTFWNVPDLVFNNFHGHVRHAISNGDLKTLQKTVKGQVCYGKDNENQQRS